MAETIREYIHRKVVVLIEHETAEAAAKAMCGNHVGCVVVSDGEGHLVGMLTDRDLTCALVARNLPESTPIHRLMTRNLVRAEEDATVDEIVVLMKTHGIRRIPVTHRVGTGDGQRCIGIITLDDLLASRRIDYEDASQIIRSQMLRRQIGVPHRMPTDIHGDADAKRFFADFKQRSGLSEERAIPLAELVLGKIVQRLHYTDAARFISLIPKALRAELMDMPAGPDHDISREMIIRDVGARFDMDGNQASRAIEKVWESLTVISSEFHKKELGELLPDDLRGVFTELPTGATAPTEMVAQQPGPTVE